MAQFSAHFRPERRIRRPVLVGGAVLTLFACLLGALVWLVARDSRVDLQPSYFVEEGSPGASIALLHGAEDVTATVCASAFACESAWGSDQMVLMKFRTREDAAEADRALGSAGYQSDWLVAHFVGVSISDTDRRHAIEALDGTWQSDDG